MKKIISLVLALSLVFAVSACGEVEDDPAVKSEGVMSYAEYVDADVDAKVVIEAYVQAKQGWWEKESVGGVATVYTQDKDGAYFIYDMPITKEDYDKLTVGTKLKVTGTKAEWEGEVEISDAKYEILSGNYVAEAVDVTALLGKNEIIEKQNMFVAFTGMTVMPSVDADGNEVAYLYKWNGSGAEGDDLYFNVSVGEAEYTFTVESYLCGPETDVYKAVKNLKIGDKIDMEGFLYWYNGINPHITSVYAAAKN